MIEIDVIVLSFAKDEILRKVTADCVSSLFASEDKNEILFHCVVLESNRNLSPLQYEHTTTLYPKKKFGFNTYVNIGLRATRSPYVVIANNDLYFHQGWATEILRVMNADPSVVSASPVCTYHHPAFGIPLHSGNYPGYEIRKEIAGWCILLKREILDTIGFFDEKFRFWYADYDYANNLKAHHLKHVLISSSVVDHLDGRTTKELSKPKHFDFTLVSKLYYEYKWIHKNKLTYLRRLLYIKLQLLNLKRKNLLPF